MCICKDYSAAPFLCSKVRIFDLPINRCLDCLRFFPRVQIPKQTSEIDFRSGLLRALPTGFEFYASSMAKLDLTSLAITLQDSIKLDDINWSYSIPNLPQSSELDSHGLIKSVSVVSNATQQNIGLRFTKMPANRATANDPLNQFVSVSFADFRLRHTNDNPPTKGDDGLSFTPATSKQSADYVTMLLQNGITINGVTYNFYGHSNSQLKSRT